MRRARVNFLAILLMFASAAAPGGAPRAGEHPWDNKRVHYLIEYRGVLREKGFFVRRPGSYQRSPCVVYDEEKTSAADMNGLPAARAFRAKTITTPDGYALYRHEEAVLGDTGEETVTVAGGAAEISARGYFGAPARIPAPGGVLFEISGDWLARQNPQTGRTLAIDVLDREQRRISRETVRIGDRLPNIGVDGSPDIWSAEFSSEGRPPMAAVFTSDGRLLRIESEGLVYQVVTREEYDLGRIAPRQPHVYAGDRAGDGAGTEFAAPAIPMEEAVPARDTFDYLILRAGPPGQWESRIRNSRYAEVSVAADGGVVVSAVKNAPYIDVAAVLPMQIPAEAQAFLASVPTMQTQDPAIIQAARTATADVESGRQETNVLKAVSYLAGWISQEISLLDGVDPDVSAVDALRSRRGCGVGHARLFAAMARSLGIPARLCQGLLVQAGRAVYHVWTEAWISGQWVPVDTTVSRVGLPAGYILAEQSGGDGALSPDFLDFLSTPALSLALTSAGRETPLGGMAELVVGDRRTYAAHEGDWLANLYWGFALRLPAGWNGRASLDAVEIVSPDRLANVKCETLEGDIRAGREELDANVVNLRDNLGQFRLVESRLVNFDPDGAIPALFMDFTCRTGAADLRCRQYVLPRRQRAFRLSFWAPAATFEFYVPSFDGILASFEF